MKKVVITGIGVVSAIGNNAADFWGSLVAGRSGIGRITKVDVSTMRFQNAAEVKDFDPAQHFDEKNLLWLDPFSQTRNTVGSVSVPRLEDWYYPRGKAVPAALDQGINNVSSDN